MISLNKMSNAKMLTNGIKADCQRFQKGEKLQK